MDAQNERKVFELVVKTACQPGSPQHFLLTPKVRNIFDINLTAELLSKVKLPVDTRHC